MRRKRRTPLRSLITLATLALAVVGGLMVAPMFMDGAKYRDLVGAQVKLVTGRTLQVKGATTLSFLPSPVLTLGQPELISDVAADPAHFTAKSVKIHLGWSGLWSEFPSPERVVLEEPVAELPRAVARALVTAPFASATALQLDIHNGKLVLTETNKPATRLENIQLGLTLGGPAGPQFEGRFAYAQQTFSAFYKSEPLPDGTTALSLRIGQGEGTALEFTGKQLTTETGPKVDGTFSLAIENPAALLGDAKANPYPVSAKGKMEYAQDIFSFSELVLESADSAGDGNVSLRLADLPVWTVTLHFARLKIDPAWFAPLLASAPAASQTPSAFAPPPENPLDIGQNIYGQVTADNLFVGSHTATSANLKAEVVNGKINLQEASMQMVGESSITLKGSIEQTANGPRFQGQMETGGKDLRALLATFEPAAEQFSITSLGNFHTTGNIFISPEQLRISEADMQLVDLKLVGGMVMYFDTIPRIEAEISLTDTDLDYFRNGWREEQKNKPTDDFIFRINSGVDFTWLRQLRTIVDLKLNLNGFTFLDRTGGSGSFRIYAKQNELGLYNIDLRYPEGALKGDVKIDVVYEQPQFDVKLSAPQFNTAYLSRDGSDYGTPLVSPETPETRWSEQLFDFSWMIGVGGIFDIAVGQITHHGEEYRNVLLKGGLQSEQMKLTKVSFERFGGRIDGSGTLIGGKVPGLSASFTAYNIDSGPFLDQIAKYDRLTGRYSVSGTVTTSGIHLLSWLKQAEIKLVIAGRGVRLKQFNLQGVVDGVQAAKSVAEVAANIEKAFPSGTTELAVDGNLNISGGIIRSPGISLKTTPLPNSVPITGNLVGEADLIGMRLALSTLYQFPMLRSETLPTLRVDVSGPLEASSMKLDTTSLEAYVAKRIVGR